MGKTLIAYRIYLGLSQQELADRLGVSASQVSRDERNEYYGATLERLQEVMEAMRMISKTEIQSQDLMLAYGNTGTVRIGVNRKFCTQKGTTSG